MSVATQVWERSRAYLAFGVLFLTAVSLFVNRYEPALRSARTMALTITAPIDGFFARAAAWWGAADDNDRLRALTLDLSTEVARLREARAENRRLRALLGFADSLSVSRVAARVVSKDLTEQANLLTIDAGTADSVEVGMPVIDERGIVGKVVLTSARHAVVMPHQNTQFAVPATLDDLGQDGVVSWDGTAFDRLTMEFVPKTEPVREGMRVTTSPYSGVFPAGLSVGRVDTAYAAAGRNDYVIRLRPAAPLSSVGVVYVLRVRPDPERERLEAAARDSFRMGR